MSPVFDVEDPTIRLPVLIERAERGEEVVIARDGIPSARIVPLRPPLKHTVEMILKERVERHPSSATDNRAARDEGRR